MIPALVTLNWIIVTSLSQLQAVQKAMARLLTGSKMRDHISLVLSSIHWLPVKFRVSLKIILFVYKALFGRAPSYISELLVPYCPARTLRSSSYLLLTVPRCWWYKSKGDLAFCVVWPHNLLPLWTFKSRLKSYFYSLAFVLCSCCFLIVDLFVHCTALWINLIVFKGAL